MTTSSVVDDLTVQRTGTIDPDGVAAVAAFLRVRLNLRAGDALPPMWHGFFLLDRWRHDELGPDGHPERGIPSPPRPGLRRMFAGGRTLHHDALRVGSPATRTSRVVRATEKSGRSGPLTFVTVRQEYAQFGRPVVVEEQDIVYRPPSRDSIGRSRKPDADVSAKPTTGSRWTVPVDNVTLFRFSALTANAHRIHYDQAYAAYEGHADLVIHGPLQVLLMAEAHRRTGTSLIGLRFEYRLVAPATGAQRLDVIHSIGTQQRPDVPIVEVHGEAGQLVSSSQLLPA